ncbi:hypothetical protein BC828DRAFT_384141 [Blastocladiella britannica]|nr:hypothetical protein BC828DRAFT_384141 [Blastocladiella britannica]
MINDVANIILAHAAGAARSPQAAIEILNVLPQHEPVLTAVLSRGFQEFSPALAVKHGHAHLLPCYPRHILLADLGDTLRAAGARGDLPALVKLWQIAGPTTLGRIIWLNADDNSLVGTLIVHARLDALDWFVGAAALAGLCIQWSQYYRAWPSAATSGHTNVIEWGLKHGYLETMTRELALIFATNGSTAPLERWLAAQPGKTQAIAALKRDYQYPEFLKNTTAAALDWWWIHIAKSRWLPKPSDLNEIVKWLFYDQKDIATIEWWWARFLEHRTPEHTFGSDDLIAKCSCYFTPEAADWLWQHSHSSGTHWDSTLQSALPFAPAWHDLKLAENYGSRDISASTLQWWVEKSALTGQRLFIGPRFIWACVCRGRLVVLDSILRASLDTVVQVDWGQELVHCAILQRHLHVLQWWDAHRDQLPDQDLSKCPLYLGQVAEHDATGILEWWHARYPLAAKDDDWMHVLNGAIEYNARTMQAWLRSHPDLVCGSVYFMDEPCLTPFTLDFMAEFESHMETPERFSNMVAATWQCYRSGVAVDSRLPLSPYEWVDVIRTFNQVTWEWWLQAHVAAGHTIVFPCDESIDPDAYVLGGNALIWLVDVIVTRKIPLLVESEEDRKVIVPFVVREFDTHDWFSRDRYQEVSEDEDGEE